MTSYESGEVALEKLLLDPNNFRFQDETSFAPVNQARFHEEKVQARAEARLRAGGLLELKSSILFNGFLPVEQVVVRAYDAAAGFFVVLEGNRRVAALKWIKADDEAGVEVSEELRQLDKIRVVILESDDDHSAYLAVMGIRHVTGIKQWGGYQSAKLVAMLRDEHELDTATVASKLGLGAREVNRRYRAYKALEQMSADEEFGEKSTAAMYPLFHEAVSIPPIREWLGWEDNPPRFAKLDELHGFYSLITPAEGEEGISEPPKISSYSEIRDLRAILPNADAMTVLLDEQTTVGDALAIAKVTEMSRSWKSKVASAISALNSVNVHELKAMTDDEAGEIERLQSLAGEILESRAKLLSD